MRSFKNAAPAGSASDNLLLDCKGAHHKGRDDLLAPSGGLAGPTAGSVILIRKPPATSLTLGTDGGELACGLTCLTFLDGVTGVESRLDIVGEKGGDP